MRTHQSPKSKLINFLLIPISIIFLIALIECSLTIASRVYKGRFSVNYNFTLQQNSFRILFIGESTTAIFNHENRDISYPAQLKKMLSIKYPKINFQIINKGVPCTNSE